MLEKTHLQDHTSQLSLAERTHNIPNLLEGFLRSEFTNPSGLVAQRGKVAGTFTCARTNGAVNGCMMLVATSTCATLVCVRCAHTLASHSCSLVPNRP